MKNVLITGAADGLGVCLVREYLGRGCRVFGTDIARRPDTEALLAESEGRYAFFQADVTDIAAVEEVARRGGAAAGDPGVLPAAQAERGRPGGEHVNISSDAGSIGASYRTNMTDYAVTKAALNMITKTIWNAWKDEQSLNILCVHPGWMRTNEGNREAPLLPYEHAGTLLSLFEARRRVKDGDLFVTYAGEAYPW